MTSFLQDGKKATMYQPKTVLYVDHNARWSGGEIALYRLLAVLNQEEYHPVVVLAEEGPLADQLRQQGIETHVVPLDGAIRDTRKGTLDAAGVVGNLLRRGPVLIRYAAKIAAIAREKRAAILHCNSLKSDIYGAIAGRMAGIPTIWHIRDHISTDYLPAATALAIRSLAKLLPTQVVTNSTSTLQALLAGKPSSKRYKVALDCVDNTFLTLPKPPLRVRWGRDSITIGIVGRLAHWKGQHRFLEAAAALYAEQKAGLLPADLPPLRFVIAGAALFGEEAYEREIREQAKQTLPEAAVEWRGAVKDIPALLTEMDLLVHASIIPEPFGQVVIEGMAAGLPVIATAGGGVCETVTDGVTGVLVPMDDAKAIADSLRSLILDPARASALGQAGWIEVRNRFTPQHTSTQIESIYAELLGVPSAIPDTALRMNTPSKTM